MADVFPSGLFNISTVDVRVKSGNYYPCRSCHWRDVCVVPKAQYLRKFKGYNNGSDIYYHDSHYASNIVYRCYEYTVLK